VVAHDVKDLASRAWHATPKSVDERCARCPILKRRDGIVVGRAWELGVALGEALYVLAKSLPRLLLAVAQLPLLARVHVRALEVADEDSTQVGPVVDLVARQVLEPCAHKVAELERQVLDDEEIVGRSTSVAYEQVVLEPYTWVGVPIVSRHIGRSPEARRELRVVEAPAKSPRTSLVWCPAMLTVVIAVVAPTASTVIVVARAFIAIVLDALSLSSGLDGVLGVTFGPESTLDRRYRGPDSLPMPLVLGRRQIQAVGGWRSSPPALRALARGRALCLLCCCSFGQRLQLLAHPSLLGGCKL
jgi:hypothetical protein